MSSRQPPSMRQRALDFRLEHALDVLRRDRSDQLVRDAAVGADDERFRHAVDPPVDRGAAVLVGADGGERIAVAPEEAPRLVGRVLVVDADDADALVLGYPN